jgi:hypothetical protein
MSKAEDLAKDLYPDWEMTGVPTIDGLEESMVRIQRVAYIKGYRQAEKDNELSWEDIRELYIIFAEVDTEIELCKVDIKSETIGYYQEVLKRFNTERNG